MLQTTGAFLTRGRCPGVEVSGASGPQPLVWTMATGRTG